ncbi:MAG: phenol 2-monooxygenase [Arcobacter sp.]|nr:MAG: phenol 2-monooxygenase [Arcobacter sp.]
MQFHVNGFHPGSPDIHTIAKGYESIQGELPEEVDVLIIGSGPAGLTLAAQLSQYPEIKTRIIEKKAAPMVLGQADGVSCRSMEMFEAFGFAQKVLKEGYWVNETNFWKPDEKNLENITRDTRVQDVKDGLSEMPHIVLNQARIHDMYLELMKNSPTRLEVDYNHSLVDLEFDEINKEYPNLAQIDCNGKTKTIKAKYVVGCDGARSLVRKSISRELKGDREGQAWGVMDVLVKTNFPDIRFKNIIKSANKGNILLIPREGGQLLRIYVELDKLKQRGESKNITLDRLIEASKEIFHPYEIDVKETAWWSVYEVGHSLTDKFDDVLESEIENKNPHVFIAGDACHTHSAKAGQGMNVSMGDTFNLAWKLISVLTGKSDESLLHTYSAERRAIAQALIDYDHKWARVMSAPIDNKTVSVKDHFVEGGTFTAGLSVQYEKSILTGNNKYQNLAKGFDIGKRFHSAPVVRLGDAKPIHLGHTVKIDAKFRIYAFADSSNPMDISSKIYKLCDYLESSEKSPILKYTKKDEDIDSVISVYSIFQQHHHDLEFENLPSLLKPLIGKYGLKDYEKMYCPDLKNDNDIFNIRDIDRKKGCIIIVRPDQYVANILPLDAYEELEVFFSNIFLLRD